MDRTQELEEIQELMETKQYTGLRQKLTELNDADIAGIMEEMEAEQMLKIFRILPKDLAADVFAYMDVDKIQLLTRKEKQICRSKKVLTNMKKDL